MTYLTIFVTTFLVCLTTTGVNSGVMLMNLTRMRHFQWEKYVIPVYQEYKTKITWGDQDIINIVFHFHPEKLYVYPCNYNYRPDHWYMFFNSWIAF